MLGSWPGGLAALGKSSPTLPPPTPYRSKLTHPPSHNGRSPTTRRTTTRRTTTALHTP
ncbi:MAG: hypothetical protein SNJ50_04250 [Cyanobacteriota bacterium]